MASAPPRDAVLGIRAVIDTRIRAPVTVTRPECTVSELGTFHVSVTTRARGPLVLFCWCKSFYADAHGPRPPGRCREAGAKLHHLE